MRARHMPGRVLLFYRPFVPCDIVFRRNLPGKSRNQAVWNGDYILVNGRGLYAASIHKAASPGYLEISASKKIREPVAPFCP